MKIYIAGPFFNEEERDSLKEMICAVHMIYPNAELFIAMDHFIHNGEKLPNDIWARKVFEMDVKAITDADMVVTMYTGHYSDTGTVWEIGYAFAKGIPVVGWIPSWAETKDMSLMVINSFYGLLDNKGFKINSLYTSVKGFNQK